MKCIHFSLFLYIMDVIKINIIGIHPVKCQMSKIDKVISRQIKIYFYTKKKKKDIFGR